MNAQREHQAFLNAIIDNPDDDLPRLVFADYLEETGDAERAEFIRIQCELTGGVTEANRKIALEEREKELLSRHLEAWRVPIRGHQKFQRGFVESLWASADNLLQAPAEIVAGSTLRTLRITNADKWIDDLAAYCGFSHIEHLDLTNNNLAGDYRLQAILGNPHLARLRGLNLHNNRIWADDVLRIAQSPVAPQLTHLDLSGNAIGNEGMQYLQTEAAYSKLEELIVRSDGLPEYECITGEGLLGFFPNDPFPPNHRFLNLRHLDIAGHRIGEEGFVRLMLGIRDSRVLSLNVSSNQLGSSGGGFPKVLFGTARGLSLQVLNFSRNEMPWQFVDYLLDWPPLATMDEFRLTGCTMDEETKKRLLASPHSAKFHLDDGEAT